MESIKKLADAIYWEKVRRAREQPPEEKLLDGPRLFDYACRITEAGIRDQYPDADERRVREILLERIELVRRRERIP